MADDGAIKGSVSDIDKKLEAFNGLATKARMKKLLVELNGTISKFKDQVRHTGDVSELKIRYCEHLEKVLPCVASSTHTLISLPHSLS